MKWATLFSPLASPNWARYALCCAALLWLTLLLAVLLQQDFPPCPAGSSAAGGLGQHPRAAGKCAQLTVELNRLRSQLDALRAENEKIRRIITGPHLGGPKEKPKQLQRADQREVIYSQEHELARRALQNNIWELFLRLNSAQLRERLEPEWARLEQQLVHLVAQFRQFAVLDQAEQWHKRALDGLGSRISTSLRRLQNPKECGRANILLCELNKGCGFGCQMHHLTYCLLVAAASNRTLVLERDGLEWRYSELGWTSVFQPLGGCSWTEHVSASVQQIEPFSGILQSARFVRLPIVDGLAARPAQLPLAFPRQLAPGLLTHHSNPPVFFIAHFLAFLMRENEQTAQFVREAEKRVQFEKGPVVGLQIRRTDKVGTEAAFHSLEEYMEWADLWFRVEQLKTGEGSNTPARRVFIATDDRRVIDEARQKYGSKGWTVFGNDETAEVAQPGSRYSDRSLLGVITDVRLLSLCDYLVCTFSSQVCRMGYELMQVRLGDAAERFHSLDDIFYFGGQLAHEMEATDDFRAEGDGEIDLARGDVIGIAGNHWDGWSKGTNRRTGQSGLFPSYLAREKWRMEDFPLFELSDD